MHTIGKSILGGLSAALLAASLSPLAAQAGISNPIVKSHSPYSRVQREQQRINEGVKNGSLTQGEYQRDQSRLQRIDAAREADRAANGGKLTAAERANLQQRLNSNSRQIYFTKHNAADQKGK
jgi:multidrug resistance efflux pump